MLARVLALLCLALLAPLAPAALPEWRFLASSKGQPPSPALGGRRPADVFFLPDGRLLARSHSWHNSGGRLATWDVRSMTLLGTWAVPVREGVPQGHADLQCRVLAEHDGKGWRLAEMAACRVLARLEGDTSAAQSPQFSPDGRRVLLWEHEKVQGRFLVRWFDTARGKELGRFEVPFKAVHPQPKAKGTVQPAWDAVTWFARDGSAIGYRTLDGRLVLVDCATRKAQPPVGTPLPVKWEEAAKAEWTDSAVWWYASAGQDRALFCARWVEGQMQARVLTRQGEVLRRFRRPWSGLLTPDVRLWANPTTRGIDIIETASGRLLCRIARPGVIDGLTVSPDGALLSARHDDGSIYVWDISGPLGGQPALPAPKSKAEAAKLWELLAVVGPRQAEPARRALAGGQAAALEMLEERLQAARPAKEASKWVAQLDADDWEEREAAGVKLVALGEQSLPPLRAALAKPLSLEQKWRVERALARIENGPLACLREIRALEVLERIGGAKARQLVERVAGGDPGAVQTREARLVLARWR